MNSTVKRTLSGIVFLAVMIGCLLWSKYSFALLFMFILYVCMLEFYRITIGGDREHREMGRKGIWVMLGLFNCVFACLPANEIVGLAIIFLLLLMVSMVIRHQDFKDNAYVFTGIAYIGLPIALSPYIVFQADGSYSGLLMLAFFIIIWSSDVGAYCFGMLFGQKIWPAKMCPEISPKKSWAGFVGGMAMAVLAAWILLKTGMLAFPLVHVFAMAVIIHVMGVFGDLFESLWKRQFGVKDSGTIMPGHGGLLDRFDSALFAIPAAYVYLMLFELV